jgi:KipI family sensor histidine kinase inhibitor
MNPHAPRIRDAGDSALLIEWDEAIDPEINARAIATAAAIRETAIAGLRDVVSTYRSVAVFFDPLKAEPDGLRAVLARLSGEPRRLAPGKTIEVPVTYGGESGPDLTVVAEWAKLSTDAVIERHAGTDYRVFMLGFLPGFAYLGSVDASIAAPRRGTPRVRVPAGSVGIAGQYTGIYPRESPGGWQLIGWSGVRVFDVTRARPSLFAPGDVVRFKPVPLQDAATADEVRPSRELRTHNSRTVTVVRPGLFTTIQDLGRWGQQASGVPVSGAMDLVSHRAANLLVGNHDDAATLEVTVVGPELRMEQETRAAITGADLQPTVDGARVPLGVATACRAGSVLRFGERRTGARAYVAFDGGIDTPPTFGSRAAHIGAALGGVDGRALVAGERLPLGSISGEPPARSPRWRAIQSGGARLRILPGPQDEFFSEPAFALLERTRFVVTPQSNRMGYRLSGASIPRVTDREMISDATFVGAIQVPASGEPILLMSDRQTTGGYPQMATVITADLPLAGQLAPGDWVEFARCTRAEAIAALRDQEAMLGGLT